ncbi:hypothetical protein [Streptomyces sp. NPDC001089]
MAEDTSLRPLAELLHSIAQDLYLSPACRAGVHERCALVDEFSAMTCCCLLCDHVDVDGCPPPAGLPLLHLAEEDGRRRVGYRYGGRPLGVRSDMYGAVESALRLHVHELRRPRVAYDAAVQAALILAPRLGA